MVSILPVAQDATTAVLLTHTLYNQLESVLVIVGPVSLAIQLLVDAIIVH